MLFFQLAEQRAEAGVEAQLIQFSEEPRLKLTLLKQSPHMTEYYSTGREHDTKCGKEGNAHAKTKVVRWLCICVW